MTIGVVAVSAAVLVRLAVVEITTGAVLVVVTTGAERDVLGGGPGFRVRINVAVSTLTHPIS